MNRASGDTGRTSVYLSFMLHFIQEKMLRNIHLTHLGEVGPMLVTCKGSLGAPLNPSLSSYTLGLGHKGGMAHPQMLLTTHLFNKVSAFL